MGDVPAFINQKQLRQLKGKRSSSRTRNVSHRMKSVDEHTRADVLSSRLEQLENDNYDPDVVDEIEDDDDYVDSSSDDGEERVQRARKRGRRGSVREIPAGGVTPAQLRKAGIWTFAKVLEQENYEAYPPHVPTFSSILARPSRMPPRRFCSVCGIVSKYSCVRCGQRYCSKRCGEAHMETRCLKFG